MAETTNAEFIKRSRTNCGHISAENPDARLLGGNLLNACDRLEQLQSNHDDLLTAIEEAYKEGFTTGYETGIEPNRDESCVKETTIFKNDFAKAWENSETKAAIAKAKEKQDV